MDVAGAKLMSITIDEKQETDELHSTPMDRTQMLVAKLNILKPRLNSADITVMEGNIQRASGEMFRGALSTMGVRDVGAIVITAQTDPRNLLSEGRVKGLHMLNRSLATKDSHGAPVDTKPICTTSGIKTTIYVKKLHKSRRYLYNSP